MIPKIWNFWCLGGFERELLPLKVKRLLHFGAVIKKKEPRQIRPGNFFDKLSQKRCCWLQDVKKFPCVFNTQIYNYKYTNLQIQYKIIDSTYPISNMTHCTVRWWDEVIPEVGRNWKWSNWVKLKCILIFVIFFTLLWGMKILHSKLRKFATKTASWQNSVK